MVTNVTDSGERARP